MRAAVVIFVGLILISCGASSDSSLRLATQKLQQVSTLEQARTVYTELVPITVPSGPMEAQEQLDRDEFRAASVRVLKTFGRDAAVKEAYAKFSNIQSDLAERLR